MKIKLKPESQMMSYGYSSGVALGSIKPPLFQTSTFVFKTAEEGRDFFSLAYGLREKKPNEELGYIYSRIDNPNLKTLEKRLTLWDDADDCAVFESGMAAISTVLLEFTKPGALVLYSTPTYGGTDHFLNDFLTKIGVDILPFDAHQSKEEIIQLIEKTGRGENLSLIYAETPANPTNDIIDITMCQQIAEHFKNGEEKAVVCVDNTYMGPLWSSPLNLGADLVLYSATKYIGGHSDLIAGAVLGNSTLMGRVKNLRAFLGNMASPHTAWMMMRSLETLKIRMEKACYNAQKIAQFLQNHPKIERVHYLGLIDKNTQEYTLYKKQYSAPGAMLSINIKGGEKEAFQFLNQLQLIQLAVSLGSTESLAQHPKTMTHCAVSQQTMQHIGITDNLVRISIGIEDVDDLIHDLTQALETV